MPRRAAPSLRRAVVQTSQEYYDGFNAPKGGPKPETDAKSALSQVVLVSMPRRAAPSLRPKHQSLEKGTQIMFNAPKGGPKPETYMDACTMFGGLCFNAPKGGPKPETN